QQCRKHRSVQRDESKTVKLSFAFTMKGRHNRDARARWQFQRMVSGLLHQVTHANKQLFGLLSPVLIAKRLLRNNWGGRLSMKTQITNINAVRSASRRVKKGINDAIIRDLKPVTDVKGGDGVTGGSKPTRASTGPTSPTDR